MDRLVSSDVVAALHGHDAVAAARIAIRAALADAADVDLSWIQPLPSWDGWTLAPDALRFLTSLVTHLRPRHILEFGSGLSTRVLARAGAALQPPCRITSVDHDPEFGRIAARQLGEQAAGCRVRFQLAPLVARDCGGKSLPMYHVRPGRFASRRPSDLVLIDGPPVVLGGREGTLYQALDFARPGTLVLLDDADREEERAALSRWRDNLGPAIEVHRLPQFAKGMAAVIIREPIPQARLEAHRLRLTAQEIAALIPPQDAFVLVDQDWWGSEIAASGRAIPFLEREGQYWGPPPDDDTAIRELDRLHRAGASFMVFSWSAFWWLDYYSGLHSHLRSKFRCVLTNDRLVVFDLRP
ncbi:MAG: class I SAM-dependent methyltransferase [Acidobacteria bacterium]|nr:class I SAM-dependent methyltransferase [Acidobacteriota bacterium]